MSTELPTDPASAAAFLVSLKDKDKDETRCSYPTCREPRQSATGTGRPSAYCSNPKHTAVTRQQLQNLADGTPEVLYYQSERPPYPQSL